MSWIYLAHSYLGKRDGAEPIGPAHRTIGNFVSMNEDSDLSGSMNFDMIFTVVKRSVKRVLGKERSGLGLALSDLPAGLGAFWEVGGNYIVMNELLLQAMKRIAKSDLEYNSFVYTILTHEYLHSIGFIDESTARRMTEVVATQFFGEGHPATEMSSRDLWILFPELRYVQGGNGSSFRIISKFDSDSTTYIA